MTTYTSPVAFAQSNAAGAAFTGGYYQALKDMRDALVACGMVQTADTGQQDFTLLDTDTVNPAAITGTTVTPFFIVRFNDSLQATKPVFIKIRMHTSTYCYYGCYYYLNGWHVQIGSSTDGAGNITGYRTDGFWLPMGSGSSSNFNTGDRRLSYASGNGSEFVVSHHEAGNIMNQSSLFTIERTRNETGAYDGEGVIFQVLSAQQREAPQCWTCFYPTNGSTYPLGWGFSRYVVTPRTISDRSSFVQNNDIHMRPVGGVWTPKFRQGHVLVAFPWDDMANYGNTFSVTIGGISRTFRNIGWHHGWYNIWNTHSSDNPMLENKRFALGMMWE